MSNNDKLAKKKQQFIKKLHDMFQLDQPELDFGLYRIMHAKSAQIKTFIDNDLARDIDEAFAANGQDNLAELKAAYEEEKQQAIKYGSSEHDNAPSVKEAKTAYKSARENGSDPGEIYDHLYRFFSRYYDKGDFMSRRYHVAENDSRAAPYAVPYDGREVYLHWANNDQYYIKSSDYLNNFSFELGEALRKEAKRSGPMGTAELGLSQSDTEGLKVSFHIVEGSEGAHNNVKESQSRFFILHAETPIELDEKSLTINFEYRTDPEKTGQDGTWQKKRLEQAEATILAGLQSNPEGPLFSLALKTLSPTEKQKQRTLLGNYLARYTARQTMDYFIHKDLSGFLRRELDFYIKNEILRLDDYQYDADGSHLQQALKKIQTLRTVARQIIAFLAQLENFQKKLWLKKKFVTETNYCITLDRVPESLYPQIAANERQREEWVRLFAIDEIESGDNIPLTADFLRNNPYLVLDTGFFEENFRNELISCIDDFDQRCNGVVVHANNDGALRFMNKKLENRISCTYIDPPYNTGSGDFAYKDGYPHSSWLSLVTTLLPEARRYLKTDGAFFSSIDDNEVEKLKLTLNQEFEPQNHVADIIWQKRYAPDVRTVISDAHEYILTYAKDLKKFASVRRKLPLTDAQTKQFKNPDNDPRGPWKADNFTAQGYRPNQMYEITLPSGEVVTPPPGRCWLVTEEKFKKFVDDKQMYFGKDGKGRPAIKRLCPN